MSKVTIFVLGVICGCVGAVVLAVALEDDPNYVPEDD